MILKSPRAPQKTAAPNRLCRFLGLALSLAVCRLGFSQNAENVHAPERPGIVLTFDDSPNIHHWREQLPLFQKYHARATLFINAPARLTESDIADLNALKESGFAVGSHGAHHVKSVDYLKKNDAESFFSDEIAPAHDVLVRFGFAPVSFAYPMSQHSPETDAVLRRLYRHARSGASIPEGKTLAECDQFFTPLAEIPRRFTLVGKGCDGADDAFLERELFPAFERAKNKSEILTLYSHNIAQEAASHFIRPATLEKILQRAAELGLAFYTFDDLPGGPAVSLPKEDETNLSVAPEIIFRGFDGSTCWVHARAAKIPDGDAVLTMQKLLLSGSDVFYAIHSSSSSDGGKTWSAPEKQAGLDRRSPAEGIENCPCDGTPAWHAASQKILLTGILAVYEKNRPPHSRAESDADRDGLVESRLWYSVYNVETKEWSAQTLLKVPKTSPVRLGGAGCTQRVDLNDGTILLPFYAPCEETPGCSQVIVVRCAFDGERLRYLEEGTPLRLNTPRGYGEPSLVEYNGEYFLTLRNDVQGYAAKSADGLHFSEPVPWRWTEDGELIGNYNTQQHWIALGGKLWLVYTRKAGNNDHVFRHRAPLFIAEVSPDTLTLRRATERIVVPERGARLGNFGTVRISENESWVIAAEWMQSPRGGGKKGAADCAAHGAENAVWLSRVVWKEH